MFKKPHAILWIVTGIAAAVILIFTLNLRSRALTQEAAGFAGTITGVDSAVYLYEQPNAGSHIVTLLEIGETVIVSESDFVGDTQWYYVNSARADGWLPAGQVNRDPP